MTKRIVGVVSCHALRHYEDDIRSTWAQEIPPDVSLKFFLGRPMVVPSTDEVLLDVSDKWEGITQKCVEMYRWALEQGFTYLWKCDLDTFVRPQQLLGSGLETFDWVGGQNDWFASGGAGYGLSKRAMEYVASHPVRETCAEDLHTAQALTGAGISLHADPRFRFIPGQALESGDLTMHLSSVRGWAAKYQPWMMHEAYAAHGSYRPLGENPAPVQKREFRRLR